MTRQGDPLAAAFALGANGGVNCGTRFCATQECSWPDSFQQRMISAPETDTVFLMLRVFRNQVAIQVQQME
jgi:NAD(P)H-dependent flavin oxidoreductase YrpB (nitropropane dioxygenase family)